MPRPGVTVHIEEDTTRGAAPLDTGQAFMVGLSDQGPVGATRITSLNTFKNLFGSGASVLKDSVMAFFMEGGSNLLVNRIVGPSAVAASADVAGATATAVSPGEWANDLQVKMTAMTSQCVIEVLDADGVTLSKSPVLASDSQAQGWTNPYIKLDKLPTDMTTDVTNPLAGGVDDNTVDEDTVTAAANVFGYQLGPGQILAPGLSDVAVHNALIAHADTHHRVALLDPPNTGLRTDLEAAVAGIQSDKRSRYAALWAPWVSYPGEVAPSTTIVPYSAIQAGIIARVDAGGNPAVSAAGNRAVHASSLGLLYEWSDDDHEAMNDQGINLGKVVYSSIETYGYRTAAAGPETNWTFFGESRTVMAIAHECDVAAQPYVFDPIDGRGHLFSKLAKDLIGVCTRYYDMDALYGATPADAFRVDMGHNDVETAQAGTVVAVVRVKTSKIAEWVDIPITKVPLDRAV